MTVDRRASFATTLTSTAASTSGQVLLGLLFLAAIALFSLPGARGASSAIGAMPRKTAPINDGKGISRYA